MARRKNRYTPPDPNRSLFPTGPEILGLGTNVQRQGDVLKVLPPEIDDQFGGGTVSQSEKWVYRALYTLLGPEGEGGWDYQESYLGGRQQPGGAVVDFIVYMDTRRIGIRLQSFFFHLAGDPFKQAHDIEQRFSLSESDLHIVDIYEQDFIFDQTGVAVLEVVKRAISGNEYPNPLASGMTVDAG